MRHNYIYIFNFVKSVDFFLIVLLFIFFFERDTDTDLHYGKAIALLARVWEVIL